MSKISRIPDQIFENGFFAGKNYVEQFEKRAFDIQTRITLSRHYFNQINICHTHDFFEMNCIVSGTCCNVIEGKRIFMKAGDAVLMHPGTYHVIENEASDDAQCINILISPKYFRSVFANISPSTPFHKFVSASDSASYYKYLLYSGIRFGTEIETMITLQNCSDADSILSLEARFTLFLIRINREAEKEELSGCIGLGGTTMSDILQYLYDNFRTVSLDDAAKRFNYSRDHISRILWKNTGSHFSDIVMGIKMNHAVSLIVDTDMKITDIADACGFASNEYFHRAFRQRFGMAPNLLRRQERDNGRTPGNSSSDETETKAEAETKTETKNGVK